MAVDKSYNFKDHEDRIYKLWEDAKCFSPDVERLKKSGDKKAAKSFAIYLPPPNITGFLHMGHALNVTIQDALIRWHRINGVRAVWFPGTDHAGIATQNVVEKMLRKEGLSRWQLGREKFLQKVWEWREKYGDIILNQLRRLGASCDWSRARFTMSPDYIAEVQKAFVYYWEEGLIYRGMKVVNWCPRCQTSLSDLEVEHKEETAKLYYIKYPFADSKQQFIIVATTRPETMLGDAAVAVSPKDARYKNLAGRMVVLPIQNRKIPIIADSAVDINFGTGAVKVTPANDMVDAEIAERHNLPFFQIINENASMTELAGSICKGLCVSDCRVKVVDELQKLGLLEKIEDYVHKIAICYRCSTVLEPILSKQWFLKMKDSRPASGKASLKDMVLIALESDKIKITPKRFEKTMIDWLKNIKDWCISRQIWWGQQLPVWFCKNRDEATKDENFIVSIKRPSQCKFCNACDMWQSQDVFDTWFSSALWPFAALSEKDLKDFYPSTVLTTGRDIINLWVSRMIFSGLEFLGKEPFTNVLVHATVLTKKGERMSKSLGTGVDPIDLIERYGADAVRFGLIWQSMGQQDMRWDETAVVAGQKFANKIWNVARYAIIKIPNSKFRVQDVKHIKAKSVADKNIIRQLAATKKQFEKYIVQYRLGHAIKLIYEFFWHKFADVYIEKSKKQDVKSTAPILAYVLLESLEMIHIFMPFVTEAIYQNLPVKNKKKFLMISR